MDIRDFVTFNAAFPDDSVWDEQGNALVPAGRTIAECISKNLQEQGLRCSQVVQHEFYGWAFDATFDDIRVWCLLQAGDAWLLLIERNNHLISRWYSPTDTEGFKNIQNAVHATLSGNKQFTDVLWYTKKDYESGRKERACRSPR